MPLSSRLASLTREQLVALVERLVARHPDLADLVDLPLPGEPQRADAEAILRHVTHILRTMGDDWRASWRAQFEIDPIVAMGATYRTQGRLDDARTVYRGVIDAVLPLYEQIRDEESEIANIVGECVQGLGECIDATADPLVRERLLRDAFDVYRWDSLEHGSYGMSHPAENVLLSRSTNAEKLLIAEWVRDAMTRSSTWGRRRGGDLVVLLVGEGFDDKAREALYAQAGMEKELLEVLLAQDRRDEAVSLVRTSTSGDLLNLAERLVAVGLGEAAADAVDHHPAVLNTNSHHLRDWLVERGRVDERAIEELVWDLHRFVHSGNVGDWGRVRALAEPTGRLPQVLPHALAAVDTEKSGFQASRARVLAAAGRVDEAEAVLSRLPEASWKRAALDVAAAAEAVRPALALALYERVATGLRAKGTKPAREELVVVEARLRALPRP